MYNVNPESGPGGAIVVKVDRDLEYLVPGYLHNCENDITTMADKIEQGDYESIRMLGHNIKGTGHGYGFDRITDIGKEIEKSGKAMSFEGIRRSINELADYLKRVRVVYE